MTEQRADVPRRFRLGSALVAASPSPAPEALAPEALAPEAPALEAFQRLNDGLFAGSPNESETARPWHAIISSRLGRASLARRFEIATIRHWTEQAVERGEVPIAVRGTAAYPWVMRACELIGAQPIELVLAGDDRGGDDRERAGNPAPVRIVPPDPAWGRDRLAFLLADRIDAVSIRPGGTLHPLLLERLSEEPGGSVRILVPVEPWGQPASVPGRRLVEELIAAGAIGYCWGPDIAGGDAIRAGRHATSGQQESPLAARRLLASPDDWLIHCTRGRGGPWPGQSEAQFRDWLLLSVPRPIDLSPLATLRRIVGQRHLIGGGTTVRGGRPVVCFSAAPLLDVIARRTFRPHLGRWDAEPYGIAILRRAARRLGAEPVIYVDPDGNPRNRQGNSGPEEETRPAVEADCRGVEGPEEPPAAWRIQPCGQTFDWTVEREWRMPGEIDLRRLGPNDAVVFVARRDEVARLDASPWPVVSIETLCGLVDQAGSGPWRDQVALP